MSTFVEREAAVKAADPKANLLEHSSCPKCHEYIVSELGPVPEGKSVACPVKDCGWSGAFEDLLDTVQTGRTKLPGA